MIQKLIRCMSDRELNRKLAQAVECGNVPQYTALLLAERRRRILRAT